MLQFNTRPVAINDTPAVGATTPAAILARMCNPELAPWRLAALNEALANATANLPVADRAAIERVAAAIRTQAELNQLGELPLSAYLPEVPVPDKPFKPLFSVTNELMACLVLNVLRDARFTSLIETLSYAQPELSKRIGANNTALVIEALVAIGLQHLK